MNTRIRIGGFLCCLLAATPVLAAQSAGSIRGVISDSTGAVLPGVAVKLSGEAVTGRIRTVVTDRRGAYELAGLPAGAYVLEASLQGFRVVRRELRLADDTVVDLDLTLQFAGVLELVEVTATKTGVTDVQSTPIAVTAFNGPSLEQTGVETLEGLAGHAPGLTISQNTGFAQLTIRGIGTNAVFAGSDPSCTLHLDGVYLARPAMVFGDLFDVERVEVLRGPQGTLYGRNSVGGTVNVITNEPGSHTEISARLAGGNYGRLRLVGSVGGPVVSDKLMGRLAFVRGTRDGFVRDLAHPDSPLGGSDAVGARAQLRWIMAERSQLLLSGDYARYDPIPLSYSKLIFDNGAFPIDNPASLHDVRHSQVGASDNLQAGGSAELSIGLADGVTLSSLTAYRRSDYGVLFDADMTEMNILTTEIDDRQWQVSEEATLVGDTPTVTWVGGLYYFREREKQPVIARLYAQGLENRPNPEIDSRAWAGFGQASYHLDERWSLTAGTRFTREKKQIETSGGIFRLGTSMPADPRSLYAFTDGVLSDAWTPKFGVEFAASGDLLLYASVTRGFKSGGFNFTAPAPGRGYDPEFALSYEGGFKTTFADGRMRLNVAGFYNDYTDLQVQAFIMPGVVDIANAASAKIKGVEIETATAATHGLQLGASLTYLDATYDQYVAVGDGGRTTNAAGNWLNNTPEWSGSANVQYELGAGSFGDLLLGARATWQSRVFFTPFNDTVETQDSHGLLNLYGEFMPESRSWGFGICARNVTDTDYITGTASFPPPGIGARPGEPRTFAVHLSYRY